MPAIDVLALERTEVSEGLVRVDITRSSQLKGRKVKGTAEVAGAMGLGPEKEMGSQIIP